MTTKRKSLSQQQKSYWWLQSARSCNHLSSWQERVLNNSCAGRVEEHIFHKLIQNSFALELIRVVSRASAVVQHDGRCTLGGGKKCIYTFA